jgi:thiamine biosynthesis protein ThiS
VEAPVIEVQLNGEPRSFEQAVSVARLLEDVGVAAVTVVVELNGAIVPKDRYQEQVIEDGDRLELIRLVGGG